MTRGPGRASGPGPEPPAPPGQPARHAQTAPRPAEAQREGARGEGDAPRGPRVLRRVVAVTVAVVAEVAEPLIHAGGDPTAALEGRGSWTGRFRRRSQKNSHLTPYQRTSSCVIRLTTAPGTAISALSSDLPSNQVNGGCPHSGPSAQIRRTGLSRSVLRDLDVVRKGVKGRRRGKARRGESRH